MKALLPFLVASSYGTSQVTNLSCNGKDNISFTLTTDSTIDKVVTTGCPPDGTNTTLPSEVYTKVGTNYNFDFDPYANCHGQTDPNDASSYSVDFAIIVSNVVSLGGQELVFTGDQISLKCTFQSSYTLTSDLGGIELEGEQLAGGEFQLGFDIIRTTSDYSAIIEELVSSNQMIYHRVHPSPATLSNFQATDFTVSPSRIRIEKTANPDVSFDIWNKDMTTCGYDELDFDMEYDADDLAWRFEFKTFLLDSDLASEYQLIVDMELCSSASTSLACTAATDQCLPVEPTCIYNQNHKSNGVTVNELDGNFEDLRDFISPGLIGYNGVTLCTFQNYFEFKLRDTSNIVSFNFAIGFIKMQNDDGSPFPWDTGYDDVYTQSSNQEYVMHFIGHGTGYRKEKESRAVTGSFYCDINLGNYSEEDHIGAGVDDSKAEFIWTLNGVIMCRQSYDDLDIDDAPIEGKWMPSVMANENRVKAAYVKPEDWAFDLANWN